MAFNISPKINVYERDALTFSELSATGQGAQAGFSKWGPCLIPLNVNNNDLVEKFGIPTAETAVSHFVAKDFLKYSSKLLFVRVVGPNARNSGVLSDVVIPEPEINCTDATNQVIMRNLEELFGDPQNPGYAFEIIVNVNEDINTISGCRNLPMQLNDLYSNLIEASYSEEYDLIIKSVTGSAVKISMKRGPQSFNCIM